MSCSTTEMPRITISGSFGFCNAGDEAAWLAVGDLARHLNANVELDIFSRFENHRKPEIIGAGEPDLLRRKALAKQPMLFVGGGIIEPRWHCVLLKCGGLVPAAAGVPRALLAASAEHGVHYGWLWRRRLRGALRQQSHLYMRDELSAEVVRQLVPRRRVEVTGDIVLWMSPATEAPPEVEGIGPFVAVSLAPRWSQEPGWRDWIAGQLANLAKAVKSAVVFVPCSTREDDDRPEHAAVARTLQCLAPEVRTVCVERHMGPREVSAILSRSMLVVGMRLHACVMAVSQRVPCVGLVYHPKLWGFAATTGCERFFLPNARPGMSHSQGAYGYSFADSGLGVCDLARTAQDALGTYDFARSEELRRRLSEALESCLRESGIANGAVA